MNFYYEIEDSIEEKEPPQKPKIVINTKFIIALLAILFFVVIILLIQNINPNRKYIRMEENLINSARKYIQENISSPVTNEIYLDNLMLNVELESSCNKVSGVLYDGNNYTPYLKCSNYESKVLDNNSEKISLYGNEIIILAKGIPFYDPGYQSNNNVEVLGEVGTTEGVYNLYYFDEIDRSFIVRKIIIINNATLKENYPEISLNGEEVLYIKQGEVFNDTGAIAKDIGDGNITYNIVTYGVINTNVLGKQRIVYSVTNSRGLTSSIERIVNVIDANTTIYADYVIEPSRKVNDSVVITLSVYGEIYDYVTLPSGEKTNKNVVNYKVSENGKYQFLIHDKMGNVTEKEVEIDNIDKDPPQATCDAIIYSNYTKIEVTSTSNKPISVYEYQVNNRTVQRSALPSYKINSNSVSSAAVVVEDNVGNKTRVSCDVMSYTTWKMDYSKLSVYLKDKDNISIVKKYSLEDYLKGVVYLSLIDVDFSKYTNNQLLELFKSFFVLKKAELFGIGKYSVYSKQLIYPINESKFCDIHVGCKLASNGGKTFYLANDLDYRVDNIFNTSYDKLSDNIKEIMNKAYKDTRKEVVVNKTFDDVLTKFNSSYTQITETIKRTIINDISLNKSYRDIIVTRFSNFKLYNINNYASKYSEALKIKTNYYWPIGSTNASSNGLYTGTPESIEILYEYGASSIDNKVHDGIAIRGNCSRTKVIASKDGKVTNMGHNDEYGDYVIITHDNNVSFIYGSLVKGSIAVSIGSVVKKGQLIGYVGKTNNNCMLYLGVLVNNKSVNPSEYVSPDNPRPATGDRIIYVEGGSVKRSVCLSLLNSGFSINATAGIMANIQRESNFNLTLVGDNGNSLGLCQWNRGRKESLISYCGSKLYTTECQLSYLLYELKTFDRHKETYATLLGNSSANDIGYSFCYNFEAPAARDTSCYSRGEIAESIYVPYILNNCN